MSKVTISINGRAFTIGCEEGQQAYLRELAGHIDQHVHDLTEKVGQIGDVRLLVMAALIVADEMREQTNRVNQLSDEIHEMKERLSQADAKHRHDQAQMIDVVTRTAQRLEELAVSGDPHAEQDT